MPSKREAFNFYVSYYDTYMMLSDKEKVQFMDALLIRQFEGIEPTDLNGLSLFAYTSQKFSIDKQIKGWEDSKRGEKLTPLEYPCQGGAEPPSGHPPLQVQEKVQVQVQVQGKEKEKVQEIYREFLHLKISVTEKDKLIAFGYTLEQVDNVLISIENYKGNKNYSSLYLTALTWLKREKEKTEIKPVRFC